jgi:hypothetical protein
MEEMFRRVVSWSLGSVFLVAASLAVYGCDNGDKPDAPFGANTQAAVATCVDALGSTFAVTPAVSTVGPGTRIAMSVTRNGGPYTPGLGSPVVHYAAPEGGTLADPDAAQTDYVAGTKLGDYLVTVEITAARGQPDAGASVCSLQAVVHVVAPSDAGANGSADGGTSESVPADAQRLDLSGPWAPSEDANQNDPAPVMSLGTASADAVSVSYDGLDGSKCDCNAYHKVIPLGRAYDCAKTTLELDYSASGSFGGTSNEVLSIRFCKDGKCGGEGGFYGGDAFVGSEQTGHSNCAWSWGNELPAAPQLHEGHNRIALGELQASSNGSCSGSFDTIDVHLEAYACFKDQDKGSATLSNLVIH